MGPTRPHARTPPRPGPTPGHIPVSLGAHAEEAWGGPWWSCRFTPPGPWGVVRIPGLGGGGRGCQLLVGGRPPEGRPGRRAPPRGPAPAVATCGQALLSAGWAPTPKHWSVGAFVGEGPRAGCLRRYLATGAPGVPGDGPQPAADASPPAAGVCGGSAARARSSRAAPSACGAPTAAGPAPTQLPVCESGPGRLSVTAAPAACSHSSAQTWGTRRGVAEALTAAVTRNASPRCPGHLPPLRSRICLLISVSPCLCPVLGRV